MCTPQSIIEQLGCRAFYEAVNAARKAGKYVLQYRTNLDKLRIEMTSLEYRRVRIEGYVREANDHGDEIQHAVLLWLEDVDKMKNYVQDLIEQCTADAKMHCFACSCPNIKWRYRLGKQAEEKIADVNQLAARGSRFDLISHPRPPPPELEFSSADNYVHFDSRSPIFKAIVGALKDPEVKLIGVHGQGGVGKTTLVEEVAKKMLDDETFKQVPLVAVSKDLNVKNIQEKLADKLNFKLDATMDEKGRAMELWNKFKKGEKYLVILDDIWEKVDLKAIGIPVMEGNIGCKVVLTSRKEDLLRITMKADRNFPIAELPEEEGWNLFKKKVGNTIKSQPEIDSLAREVCRKCKGLPVAINALGAVLEDRPYHTWKNALDKLERQMLKQIEGIDPTIWASLRESYDMLLSSDAKYCFLLCCVLLAKDAKIPIDELVRHCMARSLLAQNPRTFDEARTVVRTVVDVLQSASLLSTDDHETVVKIHDVIRDVGISIAREEEAFLVDHGALRWPSNPTNGPSYKAMSLSFKNIKEYPDGLVYPQLETLMVDSSELLDLEVPDTFFNGMKQLTVLVLTRMHMRRLPSSLAKLGKLRMLCLNECKLDDIAVLKDLKSTLEVLSLTGSRIEALPLEIRQLTSLQVLDLQDCDELMVIPRGVISNLTSLEELYFPQNFSKWEVTTDEQQDTSSKENVSLEELMGLLRIGQLTTLHIYIPDVMLLPKDLIFMNLKRFKISVGSICETSKEISGRNILQLEGIQLRNEFITLMDKAEVVVLSEIEGLKKVFHDIGVGNRFLDLKYLKDTSCVEDLEYLLGEPKTSVQSHGLHRLGPFNNLTVLIIEYCKLKYLFSPTTAKGLVHLEELKVRCCEILEGIVGFEERNDEDEFTNEVKFSKLKELQLGDLPNLLSFYAQKEKMGTTMGSSSIYAQPLFSEKVILPVLEVLEVDRLGNIVEIWDKQSPWLNQNTVSSFKLRDMKVQQCKTLMNLVPSNILPRLQHLQNLCVEGCPNIESIFFENENEEEVADDSALIIPQLRYLRISDMENLKSFYSSSTASIAQSLFNHQVILPVLEVLEVDRLGNIVEIWDKQSPWLNENTVSAFELRDMKVQQCKTLMNLVPSNILPRLEHLKKLYVEGCPNIESIFFENENEEEAAAASSLTIPQLWYLRISNMENLKSFYSSSTAYNAQSLFNHQVTFPALEKLELEGCASLKNRSLFHPYMVSVLENLCELVVSDCLKMEAVIDKEEQVQDGQQRKTDKTPFPRLSKLELRRLPELRIFCHFTRPLELPMLSKMAICDCPNIDSFSSGPVSTPNLSLKGFSRNGYDGDDTTVTAQKIKRMRNQKMGERKYLEGCP